MLGDLALLVVDEAQVVGIFTHLLQDGGWVGEAVTDGYAFKT